MAMPRQPREARSRTAQTRFRHELPRLDAFKMHPGARAESALAAYVREPEVGGKANSAVTRLLAAHLQLPKSQV